MEMSEFIREAQKIVDKKYPNFKIYFCKYVDPEHLDRRSSEIVGSVFINNILSIDLEEWENNKPKGRKALIKIRILDLLYGLQDIVNDDIERIENAETKKSRSNTAP